MGNIVSIEITEETHHQLMQLAAKYGNSVESVIEQLVREKSDIELPSNEEEFPLLKLAGIIDSGEPTDASERISEIVQKEILKGR